MSYCPFFLILKCRLHVNIEKFFLARSAGSYLIIYLMYLFGERTAKHLEILFLTQNGSLFSLYYCNSYYPAYLVWNSNYLLW